MTVYEILDQAWIEAGEPSDMDAGFSGGAFDPASANGGARMLRYMNNAIVRIANWKFRDGRLLRLRDLARRYMFKTGAPLSMNVVFADTTFFQADLWSSPVVNEDNQYTGWLVEVVSGTGIGQTRFITQSAAAEGLGIVCTLATAWDTVPDATSVVELSKNFVAFRTGTGLLSNQYIQLDPVTEIGDIMKVRDVVSGTDLQPTLRDDIFSGNLVQTGTPTQYKVYGDALWFDVAPSEERAYEILYMRQPVKVALGTDVPGIPEQYHEAIGLWVAHNLQRIYQDYEKAYATKRELEDIMVMTRTQGDSSMDLEAGGITVWG